MVKRFKTPFWLLILAICSLNLLAQSDEPEFVSLAGQFAIKLPQNYAEYKPIVAQQINGQQFNGGSYRWAIGEEQATVVYAATEVNLEKPANSELFIKAIRDDLVRRIPNSTVIGEKRTTLDGHPGLISVIQSEAGRIMGWVYLFKNRYYLLSLSISDPAKLEENVNRVTTFRVATRSDLESRFATLVDQLTPEMPSQMPVAGTSFPDSQSMRLKGKVRRIVTETEPYFGDELSGVRSIFRDEQFNEGGYLIKAVIYKAGMPDAVRAYGFLSGDRVYREQRKAVSVAFILDSKKTVELAPANTGNPLNQVFRLKYKSDSSGVLVEVRLLQADGQEWEKYTYGLGKIEHTYFPISLGLNFKKPFDSDRIKDLEILDPSGNVIETTRTSRDNDEVEYRTIDGKVQTISHERYKTQTLKYKYEFDENGNWTRRTTVLIETKNGTSVETPQFVTHRILTYY